MRLAGKRLVVTGATGIAEASARRAADEGASVFVVSIDEGECGGLVDSIRSRDGQAAFSVADLRNDAEAETAFSDAADSMGGIDGVLAVAGGSGRKFGDGPLGQLSLEAWTRTLELNATTAFLSAREGVRHMSERGGSVVLISSVLARHPSDLFTTHAYAAAKGSIEVLARSAAAHYSSRGVRFNAIAPGLVQTPMSERAASDPATIAYARQKQPLAGGMIDAAAVADAAVFFLSDESSQCTGQILEVDGGWGITEAVR